MPAWVVPLTPATRAPWALQGHSAHADQTLSSGSASRVFLGQYLGEVRPVCFLVTYLALIPWKGRNSLSPSMAPLALALVFQMLRTAVGRGGRAERPGHCRSLEEAKNPHLQWMSEVETGHRPRCTVLTPIEGSSSPFFHHTQERGRKSRAGTCQVPYVLQATVESIPGTVWQAAVGPASIQSHSRMRGGPSAPAPWNT